jgi:hypothetical protein
MKKNSLESVNPSSHQEHILLQSIDPLTNVGTLSYDCKKTFLVN